MMIYYILLLIMTFIGSLASLFFKKGSNFRTIVELLKNKFVYIGGFLYLISALLNIYILKYLDYSIVLPLTSITYLWTLFISHLFLKEKISFKKAVGIALIISGAFLIV